MSHLLQRLGRLSFRRRRAVLGVWVGLLLISAAAAGAAGGTLTSNFSVPGTESQQAIDLLAKQAPAAAGATGRIVFAAPAGRTLTGQERVVVQRTVSEIAHDPAVVSVTNPFATGTVSKNGRVAYADIRFQQTTAHLTDTQRTPIATAAADAKAAGLQVGVSGDAAPQTQSSSPTEGLGILIAFLVLAITFGSLLAAGMPLLTAVIGVGIGLTGILTASAFVGLSSAVISLAAMLGLAVGIDYALFIISRYRALAQDGMDLDEAAGRAVGTAGTAVVFAGSTVVIALVALLVTGVPFLADMGFAAAGTVALAVLVAITLVPALLGLAGPRGVKGGKHVKRSSTRGTTMGMRWGSFVTRHRVGAIGLVVVSTLALALPVLHMNLGLPGDSSKAPGTPQRTASDLLREGFGPGFDGPLSLVVQGANAKAAAATISSRVEKLAGVANVAPATVLPNGTLATVSVAPSSDPSSQATTNLVKTIRADRATLTQGTQAKLYVSGQTAQNIDIANRMGGALLPYLAVIVALAFLLLTIAFRSLLVPLTAVAGFLLSIGAALGAMVGVFQDGVGASLLGVHQTAPIVSLTPVIIIGILFGLAMDYQVFLVSGMREAHSQGAEPAAAVRNGFRQSARVVTAAGIIMVSVFGGFIMPNDPIIKSIGFTLTAGVLIDAFLIRMTLIPAVMSLLGKRAWWMPAGLHHLTPKVDLEGAKLSTERHAEPAPVQA